jgi:ATP phosphoribosyltransferase regulatory subunit
MGNERWILPEGIDEVLPPQSAALEGLRRDLLDLYDRWGYELVIPPFVEFLDSLLTGTGSDLDLQTFKLTDQISGRLMGVRADITPQAARIDARQLGWEGPTRLCYLGTVLHTRGDGFAGSRSPLQIGAEIYGHAGPESDVETLSLMLATLELAGIGELSLDLGHVGIFRGLSRQAGLTPEQERALFDALQRKAIPEIEELLVQFRIDPASARMLATLAELNGDQALSEARRCLADADVEVQAALDYLRRTAELVAAWLPDTPVHFDLAELRGYHFHTGVVFAAFVPGLGQEIARGGRYDHIGEVFGRARPATGFSTDLKTLLRLGSRPQPEPTPRVFAPWSPDPALSQRIADLRGQGLRVVRGLPGQTQGAAEMGCDRLLVQRGGSWELTAV